MRGSLEAGFVSPIFANSTLTFNKANFGGGIYIGPGVDVNPGQFMNLTIASNLATNMGGGIYIGSFGYITWLYNSSLIDK